MQAKRNRRSMMLRALFVETLEGRQLLSAGGLDTSLGGDGIVSIPFNSVSAQGNAMAVQSDGKIVEVGRASDKHFLVARYNANGSPDTTFGSLGSGVVSVHVSDDDTTNIAYAVAIQTDGKIVVAGQAIHSINGGDPMIVCRFLSNGSLDHSFDDDGIVEINRFGGTIGPADYARGNAIAIQKDGKIIIAGDEEEGFTNPNDNLVMTRLNTDGSMDNKFGTFGEIDFDHDDNEVARAIAIDYNDTPATNPDYGKIVVVGHVSSNEETDIERGFADNNAAYKALIVRFTASGKLDTSFNKTGYIDGKIGGTGASVDAQAVAIEGDGYIVVAGSQGKNLGSSDHDFLVARFTPSGTRDTSFGGNGTVIVNMGGDDRATSVVIGGFGQQVIVGGTSGGSFALAAFNNNGLLDQSFGNKGKVLTFPDHGPSNVQLALAPNHTIVAAGGNDFNTARYFDVGPNVSVTSPDPTAGPTTFNHVGKLIFPVFNPASMIVTRDEKLNIATRVFFTVSGTGLAPSPTNVKANKNNYTLSGMTILLAPGNAKTFTGYVDIPAGQTSTTVTLTPTNIAATNETATFAIQSNVDYVTSLPAGQTITLLGTKPTPPPTSTTLTDTADTYIQDGSTADTNFGTATQLLVKKSSTTGQNRETYLKFDLSSLSTVNSVKLNLFGALNNTDSPSLVTQVFSIADNSWLETGITWNKRRTPGATALASATITGTTQKLYTFDVTAYVKAQLAAGIKTVSFVLINSANTSPAAIFNSKEVANNKPSLVVT